MPGNGSISCFVQKGRYFEEEEMGAEPMQNEFLLRKIQKTHFKSFHR